MLRLFLLVALLAGCGKRPEPDLVPPTGWTPGTRFVPPAPLRPVRPGNLLANPGFEEGTSPWWYFPDRPHWGPFVVAGGQAHGGRRAARLDLVVDETHPPPDTAHVRGVIQEVVPPTFPRRISGWYYVEGWERGTPDQYLQLAVLVIGAPGTSATSRQIRYLLAGIDHPPFAIGNARFLHLSKDEPARGRWIHFERDLAADFVELWGSVPERYDSIRVLAEVRYDNLDVAAAPRLRARVYYDDLYLGE